MKHDDIRDAFESAMRFSGSLIEPMTEEMAKANNLDLQVVQAGVTTDIQNWIRDNPYVGGETGEEDAAALKKYNDDLNRFINSEYAKARWQNTSPYYQRMLQNMNKQTMETARNHSLLEQDKWRIQRENVRLIEDIKGYIDNPVWDPQTALAAADNRINVSAARRQLDPQRINDIRQAAAMELYEKKMLDRVGKIRDVNNLEAAMQEVRDMFGFMPPTTLNVYDEEGNVTGTEERPWTFDGREDWEKKILENETKRIQGEHFEVFQEKDSYMKRLIMSGNIQGAIDFAKRWGAEWNKYYNPNNPEHINSNNDLRDRGSRFFDWRTLEAHLEREARGGPRAKVMSLLDAYNFEMFIRPQIQGDGTVIVGYGENGTPITERYDSIIEALEGYFHYKGEAFFAANGGRDAYTMQLLNAENAVWMEKFYDELGTALRQLDPTLASDFKTFRDFDTFLTSGSDYYNRDVRSMSLDQKNLYAQDCVDFYMSIVLNGITDVPTIRRMMRDFTGREITKYLEWNGRNPNNAEQEAQQTIQLKAFSDRAMSGGAEDIVFVRPEPERLALGLNLSDRESESVYGWRNNEQREAVETVRELERGKLANLLGVGVEALKPHWMPSERRRGDVIPKGMFVIEGGENAGTYYLDYDNNANLVVKKQNSQGAWEEHITINRQETRDEREKRRADVRQNYQESLRQSTHPITGEGFEISATQPPTYRGSRWNSQSSSWKQNAWAVYFEELKENPDATIRQTIAANKNPLTGADFNYRNTPPPDFNTNTWRSLPDGEKERRWTEIFMQQVRGR